MRSQERYQARSGLMRSVAAAVPQVQISREILTITAYLITSAIIALWMAYLPTRTGSILTILNVLPQHLTEAPYTINQLNKGDRLAVVRFDDRWSPIEAIGEFANAARRTGQIPEECESAFSRTVKSGNFITRCVAVAATPTRLAIAE